MQHRRVNITYRRKIRINRKEFKLLYKITESSTKFKNMPHDLDHFWSGFWNLTRDPVPLRRIQIIEIERATYSKCVHWLF
jgi:hypothetical protein